MHRHPSPHPPPRFTCEIQTRSFSPGFHFPARPVIRFAHISSPAMVETDGKKNRTRTCSTRILSPQRPPSSFLDIGRGFASPRPKSKSRDLYLSVSWSKFFLILDSLKLKINGEKANRGFRVIDFSKILVQEEKDFTFLGEVRNPHDALSAILYINYSNYIQL